MTSDQNGGDSKRDVTNPSKPPSKKTEGGSNISNPQNGGDSQGGVPKSEPPSISEEGSTISDKNGGDSEEDLPNKSELPCQRDVLNLSVPL